MRNKYRLFAALAVTLAALFTVPAPTAPTPTAQAAASVSADTVYIVPADIPTDCSVDVSAQLNAFIASVPDGTVGTTGAVYSVIQFRAGCYKIDQPIEVSRRAYLKLTGLQPQGVGPELADTVIESDDVDDSGHQPAFQVKFSHHVYLDNFRVNGDYTNPGYYSGKPFEHSHGFGFRGSHDVGVSDSEVHNVRGDGVYFSPQWDGPTPVLTYNGYARNVDVDGCGRMGVAITGGHDFLIEDSDLRNCPWIFDLELEWASVGFGIEDVTIRNNTTGLYRLVWLSNAGGCGVHDDILVEGNVMERNGPTSWSPITVQNPCPSQPRTGYVIRNNTFRIPGWGSADYGLTLKGTAGAVIDGNTVWFDERSDDNNYATRLQDSSDVQITNNNVQGGWHLVKNLGNSSWFIDGNFCGEMTPCQEQ